MAWISTPPYTRSVRDDGPWKPFQPGASGNSPAGPGSPAEGASVPADTPTPVATPVVSGSAAVPGPPPPAARPVTTRIIRTIGSRPDTEEEARPEGRQLADLSLFRRYPALFHQMAARKRRMVLPRVRLSLYDLLLILALVGALVYLLIAALAPPPPANNWPDTTRNGRVPRTPPAHVSTQR